MSISIPDSARDLLERPIVATFVTVMPDGQPQATAIWFDFDGTNIRVNTAAGRQKARNVARDSKVTLLIIDPNNPLRWLEWRGHVAEIRDESQGAAEHINSLSARYDGIPVFQKPPGQQRLTYVIAPDKINVREG